MDTDLHLQHGLQKPRHGGELRLKDKVAVITGGARGIGAAAARIFTKNGASVVIADILDDRGTVLAESIGGKYIHCDVTKEKDVDAAVNLAVEWKGKLDIMFNNAGIGGIGGSITTIDMDHVKEVLAVNINGIIHGIKYAARAMIRGKSGGSIICTSSSASVKGGLGSHQYTLSKHAMIGLMKSTACELGEHGIRVNCISPHGVPSEMLVNYFKKLLGKDDVKLEEVTQIVGEGGSLLQGKCGAEDDIAHAAVFLASDESAFVTAHNLIIDGGYTAANNCMAFIYRDPPSTNN